MRFPVALHGLLLTGATLACEEPATPAFPADTPIDARTHEKLNRDVAQYIRDAAEYIACMRIESAENPSRVAKENETLASIARLVDLYEERFGPNDELIAQIRSGDRQKGRRAGQQSNSLAHVRVMNPDVVAVLNTAIAAANVGNYAKARAAIAALDFDDLDAYERSKAEQVLYTIEYKDENFAEAREHIRKSIDAGGLLPQELFLARLAIANMDVMLRLSQRDTGTVGRAVVD